jgi:hypothetical protein
MPVRKLMIAPLLLLLIQSAPGQNEQGSGFSLSTKQFSNLKINARA